MAPKLSSAAAGCEKGLVWRRDFARPGRSVDLLCTVTGLTCRRHECALGGI